MALPTITELKNLLRIQTTAEDAVLTLMLTQATALAEGIMGRPIVAIERTFVDEAQTQFAYGSVRRMVVPVTPVDWSTLVVTDVDLVDLVEDTDYRVGDLWHGTITALPGIAFSNGPYTLTCQVGLSFVPDYATRIEPVVGAAILDLAADLWHRRNPAAQAEGTGGGVYTQYSSQGVVERARQMLKPFTAVRV